MTLTLMNDDGDNEVCLLFACGFFLSRRQAMHAHLPIRVGAARSANAGRNARDAASPRHSGRIIVR